MPNTNRLGLQLPQTPYQDVMFHGSTFCTAMAPEYLGLRGTLRMAEIQNYSIYKNMYVCMPLYIYTHMHTYISIYLYIYISIYLHNYIYAYIYVSVQCLPEFGFAKFAFFPRPALSKTGRQRYVWMLWAWQMYKYRRLLGSVGLGFKFKPSKTFRGDPKQDASEFVESQCFLRPESW